MQILNIFELVNAYEDIESEKRVDKSSWWSLITFKVQNHKY